MAADRHRALGEHAYGVDQPGTAFHFDHVGPGAHHRGGILKRLLRRGVSHKRQIGEQQAGGGPATHRPGVVSNILYRHRQSGVMSLDRHP
ncbi:hypothetical protein D3C76_1525740 [compost metagenome]